MPIRILQVVHGLPRGGLENGVVNLLNHLPADEFEHGVVCLDARGEMADRLAPEVPLWTLGRERHDRRTPGRLACILRDWQPHIVHCHNWNTWPDTVAAHAMAGRTGRLIWSFHGFVDSGGMPWRRRIASHLLARHTHELLAVCRDAAGRYAGQTAIPAARFGVLYSGVDTRVFTPPADRLALRRALGLPETATLGITVASFTPIKDHASLLRAAAPLLASNSESLQLVFIGDGALRGAIEQQIATLGIGHKVRLAGQQDAVSRWLQAADFFVLPSQLEGMSCAIQEAMACGLPVIARRTGGNPELIEDGVTGLLCPPGAPDGLGAALASLSHSPALRRRLGTAARQRAEATFSLPAMVDAYAALYRRTALAA